MVDDTTVPESRAIARYAAKLAGLYPDDNLDAALSDAICDKIADTATQIYKIRSVEERERVDDLRPRKLDTTFHYC